MYDFSPPDCDDLAVQEAHVEVFKLFLTEDAPFTTRDGPYEIYHQFHDWADANGYAFPPKAMRDQHVRGTRCMDRDLAEAVLEWIADEEPGRTR